MVSLFEALSQVIYPIWKYVSNDKQDRIHGWLTRSWISRHLTTLKSAPPSRFPLWALFSWIKPSTALWGSQTPARGSSIQWPVTAKYPSVFEACHASHVKLISPRTQLLYGGVSMLSRSRDSESMVMSHLQMSLQIIHMSCEHIKDFFTSHFAAGNSDTVCCAWCDCNHVAKFQVLKSLDRLVKCIVRC